jgi:hypothetical protein
MSFKKYFLLNKLFENKYFLEKVIYFLNITRTSLLIKKKIIKFLYVRSYYKQ